MIYDLMMKGSNKNDKVFIEYLIKTFR